MLTRSAILVVLTTALTSAACQQVGVTGRLEQAVWWDDIWSLLLAGGYAQIGANERAIHWVDHAIDYGICTVRYLSERDPFLAKLRSDERFGPLMEKASRLSE